MPRRHYCCYFDHRYLARGLAMIRSLRRFEPDAQFWVLCLSDLCEDALRQLDEPNVRTIGLNAFETGDPALLEAKSNRSVVEYYFTCTPSLVRYVMQRVDAGDIVTYVDGDLYFFDSPSPLFDALEGASVSIIPHRFAPARQHLERYGLYNVGWLSFRNDDSGRAVAEWWRDRCNEWCYDILEADRFADQKYLDYFQQVSDRVVVIDHPGANLAPWNVDRHRLTREHGHVRSDGQPLIFFHFHGLRLVGHNFYLAAHCEYGARFGSVVRTGIYRPYIGELARIRAETDPLIREEAAPLVRGRQVSDLASWVRAKLRQWARYARSIRTGQVVVTIGGRAL